MPGPGPSGRALALRPRQPGRARAAGGRDSESVKHRDRDRDISFSSDGDPSGSLHGPPIPGLVRPYSAHRAASPGRLGDSQAMRIVLPREFVDNPLLRRVSAQLVPISF